MSRFGPRAAVTAIFLLNGMGLGAWAARLPAVQSRLDLGEGGLAVVLTALAAGALIGMPLAGRVLARVGSRIPTRVAVVAFGLVVASIASSPSFGVLVVGGVALGLLNGGLDVSMNAHGVAVERRIGRPVLSSMHAAWSIGGLVGAGSAALAAAATIDARVHLLAVGLAVAAAGVVAGTRLLPSGADAPERPPEGERLRAPVPRHARRVLFLLGAVALCSFVAEGAAVDWSAVYVNRSLGASEAIAALAFTTYTLAMTASRLVADRITIAVGPVTLVRVATTIAAAGLGVALLIGHPVAALVGFACLGMGLAPVAPVVFRAAGSVPGVAAGPALARTTSTGYLGFLAGPPIIGGLAELTSLPLALGAVVAIVALCAVLATAVEAGEPEAAPVPAPA